MASLAALTYKSPKIAALHSPTGASCRELSYWPGHDRFEGTDGIHVQGPTGVPAQRQIVQIIERLQGLGKSISPCIKMVCTESQLELLHGAIHLSAGPQHDRSTCQTPVMPLKEP